MVLGSKTLLYYIKIEKLPQLNDWLWQSYAEVLALRKYHQISDNICSTNPAVTLNDSDNNQSLSKKRASWTKINETREM